MNHTEDSKQDNKTDNQADQTYRIRINDTIVQISFNGSDSLNTCLASAFSAML